MPWIEVDKEREGQRLDNFILSQVKGVPKSLVYRLVRKGTVRVNSKRKDVSYKVLAGDRIWLPDLRQSSEKSLKGDFSWLLERILHEDDAFMVVDKPSGMPSHAGSGHMAGLIEALRTVKTDVRYLDLVHRLDKDTSGLILLAKKRSALKALQEAMQAGTIQKYYWAVLTGEWQKKSEWVNLALKRLTGTVDKVIVAQDGKSALTHFKRMQVVDNLTLVEAKLETGRMHQIRVHAKALGHPLLADEKYGTPESREISEKKLAKRLGLHARRLSLNHPLTGEAFDIESPFPIELAQYFKL